MKSVSDLSVLKKQQGAEDPTQVDEDEHKSREEPVSAKATSSTKRESSDLRQERSHATKSGLAKGRKGAGDSPSSSPVASRHTVKRKPKDMPRRPLSAYNFFFKEERENLIAEKRTGTGTLAQAEMRIQAQDKDPNTRKKELFASIGKIIAARWKEVESLELKRF